MNLGTRNVSRVLGISKSLQFLQGRVRFCRFRAGRRLFVGPATAAARMFYSSITDGSDTGRAGKVADRPKEWYSKPDLPHGLARNQIATVDHQWRVINSPMRLQSKVLKMSQSVQIIAARA